MSCSFIKRGPKILSLLSQEGNNKGYPAQGPGRKNTSHELLKFQSYTMQGCGAGIYNTSTVWEFPH